MDTEAKRRAALTVRVPPWMRRRFLPRPDGTIGEADRASLAGVYLPVVTVPVVTAGQRAGGREAKNRAGGIPSKNRRAHR